MHLAASGTLLHSSALPKAVGTKTLKLLHFNICFVSQLGAAILALSLTGILLLLRSDSLGALGGVRSRLLRRGCCLASVRGLLRLLLLLLLLHELRFLVGRTFWVLAILIIFYVHCVLLTFHALVVVAPPLKLIVVLILWLELLRRWLSVVTAAHVRVLHALDTAIRHVLLLPRLVSSVGPLLRGVSLSLLLSQVVSFAILANLLAVP